MLRRCWVGYRVQGVFLEMIGWEDVLELVKGG